MAQTKQKGEASSNGARLSAHRFGVRERGRHPPVEVVVAAGQVVPLAIPQRAVHDEVHVGLRPGAPEVAREDLDLPAAGFGRRNQ